MLASNTGWFSLLEMAAAVSSLLSTYCIGQPERESFPAMNWKFMGFLLELSHSRSNAHSTPVSLGWGKGGGPLIDLTQADVTSRAETGLVPHPHPRDPAWDPGRGVDGCWGHPSTCSLRNIDCWAFYGVKPGESSMSLVPPVSAVWQTHLWLTTHKGKDQQGNGPMTTTSSHGLGEAWLLLKVVSWRQIEWPRGILWICLAFSRGRTGKSRSELAVGRARFITE